MKIDSYGLSWPRETLICNSRLVEGNCFFVVLDCVSMDELNCEMKIRPNCHIVDERVENSYFKYLEEN